MWSMVEYFLGSIKDWGQLGKVGINWVLGWRDWTLSKRQEKSSSYDYKQRTRHDEIV